MIVNNYKNLHISSVYNNMQLKIAPGKFKPNENFIISNPIISKNIYAYTQNSRSGINYLIKIIKRL
jgi:hypothetical protein